MVTNGELSHTTHNLPEYPRKPARHRTQIRNQFLFTASNPRYWISNSPISLSSACPWLRCASLAFCAMARRLFRLVHQIVDWLEILAVSVAFSYDAPKACWNLPSRDLHGVIAHADGGAVSLILRARKLVASRCCCSVCGMLAAALSFLGHCRFAGFTFSSLGRFLQDWHADGSSSFRRPWHASPPGRFLMFRFIMGYHHHGHTGSRPWKKFSRLRRCSAKFASRCKSQRMEELRTKMHNFHHATHKVLVAAWRCRGLHRHVTLLAWKMRLKPVTEA